MLGLTVLASFRTLAARSGISVLRRAFSRYFCMMLISPASVLYFIPDNLTLMRILIQRVRQARVEVNGAVTGAISYGLLVFLGIARHDTRAEADYLVDKLVGLRIFPDEHGKMNRSIRESGGSLLIVSQFTLYGDCRKGRRPGFDRAAPPHLAQVLYDYFVERAKATAIPVETGIFQASMQVHLINDGPVTFLIETDDPVNP